jgi:hypothetical protein
MSSFVLLREKNPDYYQIILILVGYFFLSVIAQIIFYFFSIVQICSIN